MLLSDINYERIKRQHELTSDEIMSVVVSAVKKRREAIENYQKANRADLVQKETNELEVLMTFLPKQMAGEEIEKLVTDVIAQVNATSIKDMGKVMGIVTSRTKGRVDSSKLAALVKEKLSP